MFRFSTFHQSSCIRKFLTSSNLHQRSCAAVTAPPTLLVAAPGLPRGGRRGQAGTLLPGGSPPPPARAPCSAPRYGWLVLLCYVNGVDNAGCLFPHLAPRSLSPHAVASPTTDSNLTREKAALNFVLTQESEFLV